MISDFFKLQLYYSKEREAYLCVSMLLESLVKIKN